MAQNEEKTWLKTARTETLSDGIFAIAMTILILSFDTLMTQPVVVTEKHLFRMLRDMWPDFLHYVESFLILGAFWYQHHRQFHFIKWVDPKLLFMNIVGLMFMALIPFSTAMVGDYGHTRPAALLFELNLLIGGLVFYAHWIYATRNRQFVDADLSPLIVTFYRKRLMIIPAVSVCAILLSLVNPRAGTMLYFLVPVIMIAWTRK